MSISTQQRGSGNPQDQDDGGKKSKDDSSVADLEKTRLSSIKEWQILRSMSLRKKKREWIDYMECLNVLRGIYTSVSRFGEKLVINT